MLFYEILHGERDKANNNISNKVHYMSVIYEVLTTLIC